jgi:hypothetical protein
LNPQNPVVAVLLGWLSEELERTRIHLVEKEREKRKSEEAKQLAKEAEKIADLLNEDFAQLEMELELARQVSKRSGGKRVNETLDSQGQLWPGDGYEPTPWEQTGHPHGEGKRGSVAGAGETSRPGPTVQPGNELGSLKNSSVGSAKRRHAIFSIVYENQTADEPRSTYDRNTKTIYINLDHPQIASVLEVSGRRISDRQFRQICYEVAAVEYALAIPHEKIERNDIYDASDALYDVKDTINRITKRLIQALYE